MKITILGQSGQLAQELQKYLKSYELTFLNREKLDLLNINKINEVLSKYRHDIIINTTGSNKVEEIENNDNEYERANIINNLALEEIAKYCSDNDIYFISYSTDYVFDGKQDAPYLENSLTNPQTRYGITKDQGEKRILANMSNCLIMRVSWVYSNVAPNFLHTILNLLRNNKQIKVVSDQFGTPTSSSFIAFVTQQLINKYESYNNTFSILGIMNVVPDGDTSWYLYARLIEEIYRGTNFNLSDSLIKNISSDEYSRIFNTSINRPRYSVLCNTKMKKTIFKDTKLWSSYLRELLEST